MILSVTNNMFFENLNIVGNSDSVILIRSMITVRYLL